MNQDWVGVDVH